MSKFGSFVDYVQLTATDWDTLSYSIASSSEKNAAI